MQNLWQQFTHAARNFWRGLRQWSGDSAYETYLACAERRPAKKPLSPTEFYVEQLNRKYSRPNRCC
ncbi:MAG TPA: CstA-like transporter-associated (seleno)protein [Candidatus Baltobacteraceae bacterium]|nr:CstA-like transporter-associated (seleno)protein [Candidatus Baltobacteraceae bacterium]